MNLIGNKTTTYLWLYVQLAHICFRGAPKTLQPMDYQSRRRIKSNRERIRLHQDSNRWRSLYRRADATLAAVPLDQQTMISITIIAAISIIVEVAAIATIIIVRKRAK